MQHPNRQKQMLEGAYRIRANSLVELFVSHEDPIPGESELVRNGTLYRTANHNGLHVEAPHHIRHAHEWRIYTREETKADWWGVKNSVDQIWWSAGRMLSCLEWHWCRRHWTVSGNGSPHRLSRSPWCRSSERGCETLAVSTTHADRDRWAVLWGWCVRTDQNWTWAPLGLALLGASGRYISASHGWEVLGDNKRSLSGNLHLSQAKNQDSKICLWATFYRPLSGVIKLWNRCTGEASPEVQIADSSYSESMPSTAAHLWKERNTIL